MSRALGPVCLLLAVVVISWSRWLALVLAGFGLWRGVPLWLGRSWPDIVEMSGGWLESAGRLLISEWRRRRQRPAATTNDSLRWSILEGSTVRLQGDAAPIPTEGAASPGPDRDVHGEKPGPVEATDTPRPQENPERRYPGKLSAGRVAATWPQSPNTPAIMMEIEEIRRRMTAGDDKRLSSKARRVDPEPADENVGGLIVDGSGAHSCISGPKSVPPSAGTSMAGWRAAGEIIRGYRLVGGPGGSLKIIADPACCGPWERVSGGEGESMALTGQTSPAPPSAVPSGPAPAPDDSGTTTAGTSDEFPPYIVLSEEVDIDEAKDGHDPVPAYAPVVAAGGRELGAAGAPATQAGRRNPFKPRFFNREGLPPLDLLSPGDAAVVSMSPDELIECGILIEEKLAEFRVKVSVQDANAGPVITRYEVQPAVGVRGAQVMSLMKDLARALGVASIRMVETIPGKTCMGLELPNPIRQTIRLAEVLSSEVYQSHDSKLAMVLGKDITGEPVVADLARAPHLLVAGTTGSGKSVGVNAMILSLLYRTTPDEVRFVMIDPKMLELSIYDGIPHLLAPVVTDMKLAANALSWCVGEMERRYRLMSATGVRNLAGYNQKVRDIALAGKVPADASSHLAGDDPEPPSPLPYVVVVVDELADLMMVAGKKIEELIARLAQKARAAGIHLILATQRPSVDVITGLIKANIPTRIAFQVSSKVDSRTILDQMGAECLLGQGDMLYMPPGSGYPQRVHGAFVTDAEVHAVAEYLKQLGTPDYVEGVLGGAAEANGGGAEAAGPDEETDPLYDHAVEFVIGSRRASISAIQRHLRVGYNRAARFVEQMEASGLVSPMENNGNRTVLVPEPEE